MKPAALLLTLILATVLILDGGQANPVGPDIPADDANDLVSDFDENSSEKAVRIVSIKVRHIQTDPALCAQRSKHHPHHPQCHSYCKRQGHWVGQCKKDTCQCFS
ncbi:uncharacterized protein LOC108088575 [Drosophila ficusphila]|uniref:uncharacterized protein LOC108088575 n=1 Tax=Drosophila ficusphila TaxID=30025 RepID=UPI0007E6DC7E|nr:uncharacterized protein LOC108088575 [Drosophila ficusphila]